MSSVKENVSQRGNAVLISGDVNRNSDCVELTKEKDGVKVVLFNSAHRPFNSMSQYVTIKALEEAVEKLKEI